MPQNEYIEKAIKQHGRRFDHEERRYYLLSKKAERNWPEVFTRNHKWHRN